MSAAARGASEPPRPPDHSEILAFVEACEDTSKLKSLIENARKQQAPEVEQAAFRRLITIAPQAAPGTVEHDLWSTVFAFEHLLKQERGKTVLLSRTRQKLGRVGVVQTLTDWASDTEQTDGFNMLIERGMPDLTGEAIVLRHADRFAPNVVVAARERLSRHTRDDAILWPNGRD